MIELFKKFAPSASGARTRLVHLEALSAEEQDRLQEQFKQIRHAQAKEKFTIGALSNPQES